jgi:hypothetical protein
MRVYLRPDVLRASLQVQLTIGRKAVPAAGDDNRPASTLPQDPHRLRALQRSPAVLHVLIHQHEVNVFISSGRTTFSTFSPP